MHFAPGGPQTAHDESGRFFYSHPRAGKWRPARVVRGDREPQQRNIMAKLKSLEVLLQQEIKDLYSAENQLVKALPKMAKAATSPELREAFETHLEETKVHAERLEEVARLLETTPKGKVCKAMQGLVEEGSEVIEEDGEGSVKDLALIGAAQKVEHYEIAGYGTARAFAECLGYTDDADILGTTLEEESDADDAFTRLATGGLFSRGVNELAAAV
jgi:ferritin-like metal-binding protein YciE